MSKEAAVEATVTGNDQDVGFRALVMKQAIRFNMSGEARNEADQVVHFTLQGRKKRIGKALSTIRKGTARSSKLHITTAPTKIDPALQTFTIVDWTSSSRNITNKYDLIFALRDKKRKVSTDQAEATWHKILETTLNSADLQKLNSTTPA
jgi:acylphosphatase